MTHPSLALARVALELARVHIKKAYPPSVVESEHADWTRYNIRKALNALDEAERGGEVLELVTATKRGIRRCFVLPFPEESK